MDRKDDSDQHKLGSAGDGQHAAAPAANEGRFVPVNPSPAHASDATAPAHEVADDPANDAELSSPPDTSSVSSINPDVLGDEIVVGTRANGDKSRGASEREDADTGDGDEDDQPVISHYSKRKRTSIYEDKFDDDDLSKDFDEEMDTSMEKSNGRRKSDDAKLHVPLGYWRDSPVPGDRGQHIVVGFIDVRERLRTRIKNEDIKGQLINSRLFPTPPGPGGSWVTFERIVFLDHLIGLDHNEIKEYVRARSETIRNRTVEADHAALREGQRRLRLNPPPETPQPTPIAWGLVIPDQPDYPEVKRRRLNGPDTDVPEERAGRSQRERTERVGDRQLAPPVEKPDVAQPAGPATPFERPTGFLPQAQEFQQPQRKPTRILVGCWSKSSAPRDEDKHAVYGILGANDMFRVKLVRETMDGRYIDGNFPSGAGALWIPYDEVLFNSHLKDLTRPEVKEYVRVRQSQLDNGETAVDQIANETKAVYEAQARVAHIVAPSSGPGKVSGSVALNSSSGPGREVDNREKRRYNSVTPNQPTPPSVLVRRERTQRTRQPTSLPEPEVQRPSRQASHDNRLRGLAHQELTKMETQQTRMDHQPVVNSNAAGTPGESGNQDQRREFFNEDMNRMNRVWRSQQDHAGDEPGGVLLHGGVKYERKHNGPFKDRLVSQGTIINIDGEDYVEYRVLMKPSFF
ncbi:hypothetical protein GGR54DRAFT_634990 [Hypoxylon sp. NC1633]|nr:hypothetical protein GGR54DRAFT_634990 [Hypoxylon sp. NC1633]